MGQYTEVAGQLAKEGHRDRALLVLRKKKLSEKQQAQMHGLIMNVEEMVRRPRPTAARLAELGVRRDESWRILRGGRVGRFASERQDVCLGYRDEFRG